MGKEVIPVLSGTEYFFQDIINIIRFAVDSFVQIID